MKYRGGGAIAFVVVVDVFNIFPIQMYFSNDRLR